MQRREGELKDVGRVKTVPVRSLDEGVFSMEVWVEEAKGKEDLKNEG